MAGRGVVISTLSTIPPLELPELELDVLELLVDELVLDVELLVDELEVELELLAGEISEPEPPPHACNNDTTTKRGNSMRIFLLLRFPFINL